MCAERERALAPLPLGLEDAHVLDAREQRGLERHQADRPRAEDDGPGDGVAGEPEAHGVHAVGQRLDERADARGHAVGQGAHVGRRRRDEVGERAGMVDADERAPRAQVLVAGPAQPARAAAGQRVDGDARAVPRPRAVAGRDDHARELVPHDQRRRAVAHVAEVALDLRAADPDRLGAHDQLAGAGIGRLGALLDRHPSRPVPHDRLHARHLLTSAAAHDRAA
jgi:hypothetical protein